MKMTVKEWNEGINFLKTAEVGCYAEHNNRKVWVEDMCGGRYLLTEGGEVCGLTFSVIRAMVFLDR